MHNKPHTLKSRAKMALSQRARPRKWGWLPAAEIVEKLLGTEATVRSLAAVYGCSDSTIKKIFREAVGKEERLQVKRKKQAASLKGYQQHPGFGASVSERTSGDKNPFYGRRHSATFCLRQSERKRGKRASLSQRIKHSASIQGIPPSEWTSFRTDESKMARRTLDYVEWRTAVFERDNYTCLLCGKRGDTLHPHHIKKFSTHPALRYEVSNGATLCATPCHRLTLGKEEQYESQLSKQVQR